LRGKRFARGFDRAEAVLAHPGRGESAASEALGSAGKLAGEDPPRSAKALGRNVARYRDVLELEDTGSEGSRY
jgi:hypothetical protein